MARYHRACADHSTIPDSHTFQDNCTRTDPDIATDSHRTAEKRLFSNGAREFHSVVMVRDIAAWSDKTAPSDLDAFRCVKHGEAIYVSPSSYNQSRCVPAQAGRQ